MKTSKTKLGPDHPDTLSSMNNLAFTCKESGRVTKAVKLMEEYIWQDENMGTYRVVCRGSMLQVQARNLFPRKA